MNTTTTLIASAVLAAVSMAAGTSFAGPAAAPSFKAEKCYGVVKAGKNDCQTASASCAGTSKKDAQVDAWVYVPEGTCAKITGASLQPKV